MGNASLAQAFGAGVKMTFSAGSAALAFDAIAEQFDSRFGGWASVAAQRRAVRAELLRVFPAGGRILEIGGGTGLDAAFLAARGFEILLTDASPVMVALAQAKLAPLGALAKVAAAEEMDDLATQRLSSSEVEFDGAFSNFAALNCVTDFGPVARGLARLLKPGAPAMLVFFGTFCPGETVTEILRGRPHFALRRFRRGAIPARLSGREFPVVYHRCSDLRRAFAPWFLLERRIGIGITVPPSAAEPWITRHPRLLAAMETFDHLLSCPMAILGDHVLYQFRRTSDSFAFPASK